MPLDIITEQRLRELSGAPQKYEPPGYSIVGFGVGHPHEKGGVTIHLMRFIDLSKMDPTNIAKLKAIVNSDHIVHVNEALLMLKQHNEKLLSDPQELKASMAEFEAKRQRFIEMSRAYKTYDKCRIWSTGNNDLNFAMIQFGDEQKLEQMLNQ